MADTSSLAPLLAPEDQIQFVASHRPSLEDGHYTLEFRHHVQVAQTAETTYGTARDFWVLGPKFQLDPQGIRTVFPPPGSQGSFWNVFPHVILERSTLPWERSACDTISSENDRPPWLALLLFSDQVPALQTMSIQQLAKETPDLSVPDIDPENLEPGQHKDDQVQVIDVPWSTLKPLLPSTLTEFSYLAHARRVLRHIFTFAQLEPMDVSEYQHQFDGSLLPDAIAGFFGGKSPLSDRVAVTALSEGDRWRIADAGNSCDYEIVKADDTSFISYAVESERAVVVGNRLPAPGMRNVAHLVSLEDRYTGTAAADFAFENVSLKKASVRLVSLKHWDFFCIDDKKTFKGLLEGLNGSGVPASAAFRLPYDTIQATPDGLIVQGQFPAVLDLTGTIEEALVNDGRDGQDGKVGTLLIEATTPAGTRVVSGTVVSGAISQAKDAAGHPLDSASLSGSFYTLDVAHGAGAARDFLKSGFLPMPHAFRQGDRSVSWYHGPFVPREMTVTGTATKYGISLPAQAADQLLLYDQTWGMFDVSYAAAWELGRMLTLRNGSVALSLFNWKRRHANVLKAARHLADYGYDFPIHPGTGPEAPFPSGVAQWLNDLALLRPVPFNYLVPDERLLPPESLRIFTVDRMWLECLRDGAFSVGRVLEHDLRQDTGHLAAMDPIPTLCGVLIRSEVVAGWPGLHVEAYGTKPTGQNTAVMSGKDPSRRSPVRIERLSKNILLCLFEGTIAMVDMHLDPEMLHFGLDLPNMNNINENDPSQLIKTLRNPDGSQRTGGVTSVATSQGNWLAAGRVVSFATLAAQIPEIHSPADFALQLVAGVDLVRFIR